MNVDLLMGTMTTYLHTTATTARYTSVDAGKE